MMRTISAHALSRQIAGCLPRIGAFPYLSASWQALPEAEIFLPKGRQCPGTSLQVLHTPGHSQGSICLYESALLPGSYGVPEGGLQEDGSLHSSEHPDLAPKGKQEMLSDHQLERVHQSANRSANRSTNGWACLISGDTLFRDGIGRTDAPDSNSDALIQSLHRLASFAPETLVFPGHGPRTTIGREMQLLRSFVS